MLLALFLFAVPAWRVAAFPQMTTSYSYSNTSSSPAPTAAASSSLDCPNCFLGEVSALQWEWPEVEVSSTVVATLILKVNRYTNTTVTDTIYNNVTYSTLQPSDYGSGVEFKDGTPVKTYTATVYTSPGEAITFTTDLTFPTDYSNLGWLYWTADATTTVDGTISCSPAPTTQFALTPPPAPPGFTNPYEQPVLPGLWSALLPDSVTTCKISSVAPARAIVSVSALTDTSVVYDDSPPPAGAVPVKNPPQNTPNGPNAPDKPSPQPVHQPNNPTPNPTPKPQSPPNPIVNLASIIQSLNNNKNNPPNQHANPAPQQGPSPANNQPDGGNSPPAAANNQPNGGSNNNNPAQANNQNPATPANNPNPNPTQPPPAGLPPPSSPESPPNEASAIPPPVITIGSQPIPIPINAANPGSPIVIGSQTLIPGGPAITISGTAVSLAPSATAIIVGGLTTIVIPGGGSGKSTSGLGPLILSGIGASGSGSGAATETRTGTGASPALFTGGAASFGVSGRFIWTGVGLGALSLWLQ